MVSTLVPQLKDETKLWELDSIMEHAEEHQSRGIGSQTETPAIRDQGMDRLPGRRSGIYHRQLPEYQVP